MTLLMINNENMFQAPETIYRVADLKIDDDDDWCL